MPGQHLIMWFLTDEIKFAGFTFSSSRLSSKWSINSIFTPLQIFSCFAESNDYWGRNIPVNQKGSKEGSSRNWEKGTSMFNSIVFLATHLSSNYKESNYDDMNEKQRKMYKPIHNFSKMSFVLIFQVFRPPTVNLSFYFSIILRSTSAQRQSVVNLQQGK